MRCGRPPWAACGRYNQITRTSLAARPAEFPGQLRLALDLYVAEEFLRKPRFGPNSARISRTLAEFGQLLPPGLASFDQPWAKLGRGWSKLAKLGQLWPDFGNTWPMMVEFGAKSAQLSAVRPSLAKLGPDIGSRSSFSTIVGRVASNLSATSGRLWEIHCRFLDSLVGCPFLRTCQSQ